jgi:hypothetical protein
MATRRRLMPPARASAIHLPVLRPTPPLLLPPLPTPSALHGGGRGFHPLLAVPALAKLLLVKKVGIWGAYGATKVYGWPRVTRNLLKFNQVCLGGAVGQSGCRVAGVRGTDRSPEAAANH